MSDELTFTVFTATYNRARTLSRTYTSLCAQTFRDFEWLVIDDGSTDGTGELVAQWQREASFPIRYIWKENGGKHTAHNLAIQEARGYFFIPLDSDDGCVPHALERFSVIWQSIPAKQRETFAGMQALCQDPTGKVIGDHYPADIWDAHIADCFFRMKVRGDKFIAVRTDILRLFPFPNLPVKASHIPEGFVWLQVGRDRQIRFFNEPLSVVYTGEIDSLSQQAKRNKALISKIAPAFLVYYRLLLNDFARYALQDPASFLRATIHFVRFSFHTGETARQQWRTLRPTLARMLYVLALIPGWLTYRRDLRTGKTIQGQTQP